MLSDLQIIESRYKTYSGAHAPRKNDLQFARAIESAACAERDARIAELERQLQAYEEHGVTCQTFRHFVNEPCAECNLPGRCAKKLERELEEARKDAERRLDLVERVRKYPENIDHKGSLLWGDILREVDRAAIKEQT